MNIRSDRFRRQSYYEHIQGNQTFTEIARTLSALPSPKSQLFNALVSILELKPNYIRMVLCPTNSGKRLGFDNKKKIADYLLVPIEVLFPSDRGAIGSLTHLYSNLQTISLEYLSFLEDIRSATGADRRTVSRWVSGKHRPSLYRQRILAAILGSTPSILFP